MMFMVSYETSADDGMLLNLALVTLACCSDHAVAKAKRRCVNAFRLIGWQALPERRDSPDILVYDEAEVVHRLEEQTPSSAR